MNENWLRNGGSEDSIFIKLSENEEIEKYTQALFASTDDVVDLIKNFIVIYEKLDENSKKVLKDVARNLLDKTKNK